ncbi:hypothetical protein [Neomoorella humiferrea]|uniref:Hydroxyneurosporene synthase CrtC n=1 Tax=Neomoorella humiferrea TaxID=676965 RepID=A0A2T0AXK4_9FIRM|nr:hypothetical protein [Moorella humiferrea]PRR75542.1 hypothetical protein MOHU_03090 [Moorella humiferrea]
MRESTFSFWQDTEFNVLPSKPLTPTDYSYHASTGEEECWFWEAGSPDGCYLNVSFCVCNNEGKARLMVARPGRDVIVQEYTAPIKASTDHLDIQMAGSRIYQAGNDFYLEWRSEELRVDLVYKPLLPPWQPGQGRINYGEKGDKYLVWSVPIPRANISGKIVHKEHEESFYGEGMGEYLRYNFPLSQALGGALKGRFYSDSYTLLWADFWGNLLYSGKHVRAFYCAHDKDVLASTGNLEVQVLEQTTKDNLTYPAELSLEADITPLVRLDIEKTKTVGPPRLTVMGGSAILCIGEGKLTTATAPEKRASGRAFMETLIITRD